jgi:hypothetical protein
MLHPGRFGRARGHDCFSQPYQKVAVPSNGVLQGDPACNGARLGYVASPDGFFSDHTGRPEAVHGVVVLALIIAVILGAARRDQKAVPLEFKPCRH